jgi:hypothetical protein
MERNSNLTKKEKESAKRTLKRLRILLFVWLLIFILTVLWFSLSQAA